MVEERASAIDTEGESYTAEDLLEGTALCIGAVEDGYRAVGIAITMKTLHFVGDPESFEVTRERLMHSDRLTDRLL